MKKQVMMYGMVVLCILIAATLSGCGESQSNPEPAEVVIDMPSAPQTDNAVSVQTEEPVSQPAEPTEQPVSQPTDEERAQKKLQFAESYMASAKKGLIPYAQPVKICRDIIKENPGTTYETFARELLKEVPENQRDRYNITNEELGL